MKWPVRHGCPGKGPADPARASEPPRLGWSRGWRLDEHSPDEVREASVQPHGGGGATEHGQNALQVQKLQLLTVTAEEQDQHTNAHKVKAKLKR